MAQVGTRHKSKRWAWAMGALVVLTLVVVTSLAVMVKLSSSRVVPLPPVLLRAVYPLPPTPTRAQEFNARSRLSSNLAAGIVREDARARHLPYSKPMITPGVTGHWDNHVVEFFIDYGQDNPESSAYLHHLLVHVRNYPFIGQKVTWEALPDKWASCYRERKLPGE